jgi:hypothetical protein
MKRLKWITPAVGAGIIVLAAGYYAVVPPLFVRGDAVADGLAKTFDESFDLRFRYEDVSFRRFLLPAVVLRGVVATNREGKHVLEAEEMTIDLAFSPYLTLKPRPSGFSFAGAYLDVGPGDVKLREGAAPERFRGTVNVKDSNAYIEGAERSVTMRDIDGRVRVESDWVASHSFRGKLRADSVFFGAGPEEGPGFALAAEGEVRYEKRDDGGLFTFDGLDVLLGESRLALDGTVETGPGPNDVDVAVAGKGMKLSHVVPALRPEMSEMDFGGTLDVDVTVSGQWGAGETPSVDGTLELSKCSIKPEDGEGVTSMAGRIAFNGNRAVVENVSGQTKGGAFNVKGAVDLTEGLPFEGTVDGALPLEVVAGVLGVDSNYLLGGRTVFDLDARGALTDPNAVGLDGTVELKGCRGRVKPFKIPFENLTGKIYFDGQKIKVGKVKGTLADGAFEIKGEWDGFSSPNVEFEAESDETDLDAALPDDEERAAMAGRSELPPGLPGGDVRLNGRVKFKECKLFGARASNLESEFNYSDSILNLTKLNFKAYEGEVRSEATIYLEPTPRYTFSVTVKNVRLGVYLTENEYLEDALTGRFSAVAVFTAEGTDAATVKRTFSGKGVLEYEKGRATNLKVLEELAKWSGVAYFDPLQVSSLDTMVSASGGVLETNDFTLKNPNLEARVTGSVNLNGDLNLRAAVTFEKRATDALITGGEAMSIVRGPDEKGRMNFVIEGTWDEPSFRLDTGSLMEEATRPPEEKEWGIEGDKIEEAYDW